MANEQPGGAGGGMAALLGMTPGGPGAGEGGSAALMLPPLPGSEGGTGSGSANGGQDQKPGVAGSGDGQPVHMDCGRHGKLTRQELEERLDRQLMHDDYTGKTTSHSEAVKKFTTEREAFQQQLQEVSPLLSAVRKLPPDIQAQLLKGDYSTISRASETDAALAENIASLPPDDPARMAHKRASVLEQLVAEKSKNVDELRTNLEAMADVMFNIATERDLDAVQRDFTTRGVQFDREAVRKAIDESGETYSPALVTSIAKSMHEQAIIAAAVERGRQEAQKQHDSRRKDALPTPGSGTGSPQGGRKTMDERFQEAGSILDNLYKGLVG